VSAVGNTTVNVIEDLLEPDHLGGGGVKSTLLSSHSDEAGRLCGTHRCVVGRGHCEQMRDGPLCVCVQGYYGPDCQHRTLLCLVSFVCLSYSRNSRVV